MHVLSTLGNPIQSLYLGPLSFRSHESSGGSWYSDSTRCLWYTQQEKKVFCDLLVHSDLIPLHVVTLTLWGDALQLLILVHGDHNYPFEGISMKSITLQSLVSYMVDLRMESQRLMWWSLPFEEIAHGILLGQIEFCYVCRVWYVVLWPLCYRVWYIVTLGDLTWNPFPSWGYFHHSMAVVSVWIADVPVLPYKLNTSSGM